MSDSRSKYDSGTQRGRDRALGDDSWRRESRSDPDSADGRYDRVSRYDDKQGGWMHVLSRMQVVLDVIRTLEFSHHY